MLSPNSLAERKFFTMYETSTCVSACSASCLAGVQLLAAADALWFLNHVQLIFSKREALHCSLGRKHCGVSYWSFLWTVLMPVSLWHFKYESVSCKVLGEALNGINMSCRILPSPRWGTVSRVISLMCLCQTTIRDRLPGRYRYHHRLSLISHQTQKSLTFTVSLPPLVPEADKKWDDETGALIFDARLH